MELLAVVLALVLTLATVLVGMAKVQHLPASLQVRDAARISPAVWTLSGWVELVAAGVLVVGIFAVHAAAVVAAGVLAVMFAALAVRQLVARMPPATLLPAVVLAGTGVAVVVTVLAAGV